MTLRLPDPAIAPNYRQALDENSHFVVRDVAADRWVSVEPGEGGGQVYPYFEAHRICDANTVMTDGTWQPLKDHPALEDHNLERRQRLLQAAAELGAIGTPEATLQAIREVSAVQINDAPQFLTPNLPALWDAFPEGSLWLISVDEKLLSRMTFLRSRYALELTPDIPISAEAWVGLRALEGHSITGGVASSGCSARSSWHSLRARLAVRHLAPARDRLHVRNVG